MSSPDTVTYIMDYSELMRCDQQNSFDEFESSRASPKKSSSTYCLFLGDISLFCSEEDLIRTFSAFGELADVRIKRNKVTKRNLSYGFVEYYDYECANEAVRSMNGKVLCGRTLKVSWSEQKGIGNNGNQITTLKTTTTKQQENIKFVSVYIAFNSTVPNLMINDESLRVLFGRFGELEDVSIKQSIVDSQSLCQRGYAFVCFESNEIGMQAALNAASQLTNCHIDGVHYRCELSNSLRTKLSPSVSNSHPNTVNSNFIIAPKNVPTNMNFTTPLGTMMPSTLNSSPQYLSTGNSSMPSPQIPMLVPHPSPSNHTICWPLMNTNSPCVSQLPSGAQLVPMFVQHQGNSLSIPTSIVQHHLEHSSNTSSYVYQGDTATKSTASQMEPSLINSFTAGMNGYVFYDTNHPQLQYQQMTMKNDVYPEQSFKYGYHLPTPPLITAPGLGLGPSHISMYPIIPPLPPNGNVMSHNPVALPMTMTMQMYPPQHQQMIHHSYHMH